MDGTGGAGGAGADGDQGLPRRALIIGGTAAAVGAGVLARDELRHLWWRAPGVEKPREEGEVDQPGAEWVAASEANWRRADRPADYGVDRIVIHVVQGSYPIALKVFQDPGHGAAAHYVVRKDGHIAQTIRELDVAYHAGNRRFNERSVGIEHEGWIDRPRDFTDAMLRSSARLTASICARYDFPPDREHIIGHIEVPGADHTDPGRHWPWERYMKMVRQARTEVEGTKAAVRRV